MAEMTTDRAPRGVWEAIESVAGDRNGTDLGKGWKLY